MANNINYVVAMNEAKYLYTHSVYMDRQQRYEAVISLSEWELFSVGQLAQISGLSTSTLYGMDVKLPSKGSGRFNPQSLDTLLQLRLNFNNKLPLNKVLLQAAVDDGNSRRVISKLTGLGLSTIARKLNVNQSTNLLGAAS
jgi:hypothetical protein